MSVSSQVWVVSVTLVACGWDRLRVRGLLVLLSVLSSCGRFTTKASAPNDVVTPVARLDANHLEWMRFIPENVSRSRLEVLPLALLADPDRASLAAGFALERPQFMDIGVYGKIGTSTAFVARRSKIQDYDRLYWVMVRVLSEKYGCFIHKKTNLGQTVRFECRDKRTIVLDRDISGGFAKFAGRQFDQMGREIIMRYRPVAHR